MKKYLLLILLVPLLIGWTLDGMDSPTTIDGMTGFSTVDGMTISLEEVCVGYPSTACVPDSPVGTLTAYGVSGDRVYARRWTATENGRATEINVRWGVADPAPTDLWVAAYNGTTLMGYVDASGTLVANTWSGFLTLVESGDLDFVTDDVISISIVYDAGAGHASYDDGVVSPSIWYDNTNSISGSPNSTVTWTESGIYDGLAAVLKYTK